MTILVTGGAGFIGSNFVLDWLQTSDETVVNLDKLTYAGNAENLRSLQNDPRHIFVHGDIGDAELLLRLLSQYRMRAIVNCAAESHVDRSIHAPEAFIQTNIVGCFRLLETARIYWQQLDDSEIKQSFRLLHVSTDEVYGSLSDNAQPCIENQAYQPNSPYAASKAASDHLVRAYHQTYGLPALTSHCSNNYGPRQFPEKLIPLCIDRALSGQSLPIYGDGRQIRDWLYVGDHCSALRLILAKGRIGEVYNVGGGNESRNIDAVNRICRLLDQLSPRSDGKSYREQIHHVKDRSVNDYRYALNPGKLQTELGWKAKESLETGLQKTLHWYIENRDWLKLATSGDYRFWQQ